MVLAKDSSLFRLIFWNLPGSVEDLHSPLALTKLLNVWTQLRLQDDELRLLKANHTSLRRMVEVGQCCLHRVGAHDDLVELKSFSLNRGPATSGVLSWGALRKYHKDRTCKYIYASLTLKAWTVHGGRAGGPVGNHRRTLLLLPIYPVSHLC